MKECEGCQEKLAILQTYREVFALMTSAKRLDEVPWARVPEWCRYLGKGEAGKAVLLIMRSVAP